MNLLNLFNPRRDAINRVSTKSLIQITQIEDQIPLWSAKITPGEIAMALHSANNGNLRHLLNLYNNLYKLDDNLAGDTDVRVESIKSASWSLPENLSKKQIDFFTAFLDDFYPTLVDQATDLKLTGALFRQIVYKLENGLYTIDKFISYEGLDLRKVKGELLLFVDDEPQTLQDDKFISLLADYSVYESIVKYYAFFSFALNNWASFIEIYGKPVRIGKYKPGSSTEEKNLLKQMVKNLGTDLGAVISENTLIEFADFKNASANANLYSNLLDFCKKSISKRILGQTLTTNTETTGSYAQAKVHNMVRQDILQADIRDCTRYISFICSRLNRLNFNNEDIKIKLTTPQHVDLSSRIDIDTKLNYIIEIEPDYWYSTYNIPIPKKGAKLKILDLSLGERSERDLRTKATQNSEGVIANKVETQNFVSPSSVIANEVKQSPSIQNSKFKIQNSSLPSSNELKKIKSFIKNAKSYKELQDMAYPVELYTTCANEMYQTILDDYISTRSAILNDSPVILSDSPVILSDSEGSPSIQIDWTLEDTQSLNAFRAESFIVAGVTSQTLLDMIKSEAEKAFTQGITFDDFRDNLKLNGFEPENPYYLRTNFNQAVNTARASAEWKNYQDTKDFFPYLRYVTMNDDAVRDEHQQLNGIVRHIDDPFWDTFLPPNDWGCRCDVEPVSKEEAEGDPNLDRPVPPDFKIKEEFKRNPGKDNSLFGDRLSCDDAKNLSLAYPQMSGRNKRLHIFNAGKKHCPDLYTKTYNELGLPKWKKVVEEAKDIAPELLKLKSQEEYKKYFEKNIVGTVMDTQNFPVQINKEFFEKLTNSRNATQRLERMDWIKPTLQNPDEIWLQKDKSTGLHYYTYVKAFVSAEVGGFAVVEIEKGRIRTFFEPDTPNYFDNNRKGFLVKK